MICKIKAGRSLSFMEYISGRKMKRVQLNLNFHHIPYNRPYTYNREVNVFPNEKYGYFYNNSTLQFVKILGSSGEAISSEEFLDIISDEDLGLLFFIDVLSEASN